jgi:hypothetical protein
MCAGDLYSKCQFSYSKRKKSRFFFLGTKKWDTHSMPKSTLSISYRFSMIFWKKKEKIIPKKNAMQCGGEKGEALSL